MKVADLPARQLQIARLVADGLSLDEVAKEMGSTRVAIGVRIGELYDALAIEGVGYTRRLKLAHMIWEHDAQPARAHSLGRDFDKMMQFAALVVEHGRALKDYE